MKGKKSKTGNFVESPGYEDSVIEKTLLLEAGRSGKKENNGKGLKREHEEQNTKKTKRLRAQRGRGR